MNTKRLQRKRRAKKTRAKISLIGMKRLTVFRSNNHIYAQIMNSSGSEVIAAASSNEELLRQKINGNIESAIKVGELIAERAKEKGIKEVAFDRSGYKFHGRVKALAEAAKKEGLVF